MKAFILTFVLALMAAAQNFKGTVKSANPSTRKVVIANDPMAGGMDAMTMSYAVDDAVLIRLKPGDRITADYKEGDLTLRNVQILNAPATPNAPGLTLDEFERMALANNPTLPLAQANIRAALGNVRQATLYPNPKVGYYGDEIRGGFAGGGKQGGFISQNIVTGGKLGAARRVAELLRDQQQTTAEIQKLRIQTSVRMMFYEALAAQRLVEVRENLVTLATDATKTSRELANLGQADRPDVLQAEVEQQRADVMLRTERQNLQAAWRGLVAMAGQPNMPLVRLEGNLEGAPDLTYEEWLARTLRESPEIKFAEQSVERAEASLTQAKKMPIPDLELQANLTNNFEPIEGPRRAVGLNAGVQIGVELPIFNRNQGGIASARANTEGKKQELARLKLQISRDLASLFRDYDSARLTARQYKDEMLPRAEQAYQMYRTTYQKMQSSWPLTLMSQRTLFQLEVDYVAALETTWQSALSIQGFGLTGGLTAPK